MKPNLEMVSFASYDFLCASKFLFCALYAFLCASKFLFCAFTSNLEQPLIYRSRAIRDLGVNEV